MQPPPRKVKETQEVKVVFSEQVSRLQSKHQLESELLEDVRSFSKQRAAVEKEYGQALLRLTMQYRKRDWQRGKGDSVNSGGVFAVWRSLVEATARSGACRLNAAEEYRSLTVEAMKTLRAIKEQRTKRGLDQLQRIQGELVDAVRELNKVKKRYWQLGHISSVAREKAADAQARSKKSDHRIFHFRSGLQKMNTKLNARLSECDRRLTEVRNEYLLTLAAINSHHQHYLSADLPAAMTSMDGDLYPQLREHFTLLCRTEIDACQSSLNEFVRLREDSSQVTRETDLQLFLGESPVFGRMSVFLFLAAPGDKVCSLEHQSTDPNGESCLDKEARKWATRAAKDYKIVAHGERALQTLECRWKLLTEEPGGELERKIEEVKESVRKAQVNRVKAESRLALLATAGVDVEPWRASAMTQAGEELEKERRLSEARMSNGENSLTEDDYEFTDFEEFDENSETFTEVTAGPCTYPVPCRVLYSYQGCQVDELSITEGEELEVIEDGDMEDWLKARNAAGQVGYVPERYLQFLQSPAEGTAVHNILESPQLDWSFSSSESSTGLPGKGKEPTPPSTGLVRALYEYHGQSREELSFPEGALIRLRSCRHGDVDDGFWEGELDGRVGVFPSLVVELLGEGEEDEGEQLLPMPKPPPFSPPIPIMGTPLAQHCSLPGPGSWSAHSKPPRGPDAGPGSWSAHSTPPRGPDAGPGSWSAHSTPPRGPDDRLQVVPQDILRLSDRVDGSNNADSSSDLSSRSLRPARKPPLSPVP